MLISGFAAVTRSDQALDSAAYNYVVRAQCSSVSNIIHSYACMPRQYYLSVCVECQCGLRENDAVLL